MNTETYTKIILTVIALCLSVIVLRETSIVPEANAQAQIHEQVVKVQIVNSEESPFIVRLANDSLGRTFEVKIRD
jgi:hypothetical protein